MVVVVAAQREVVDVGGSAFDTVVQVHHFTPGRRAHRSRVPQPVQIGARALVRGGSGSLGRPKGCA